MVGIQAAKPATSTSNPRTLAIIALVIYLISWASPVHDSVDSGWAAFRTCWPIIGHLISGQEERSLPSVLGALSPHTNYIFVLGCLLIFSKRLLLRWSHWTVWLLAGSVVCNAVWLSEGRHLRIGYYLWLASFLILTFALVMKQKANARS